MNKTHKVFISYHHSNDQAYKKKLQALNKKHDIFTDVSVDTGDINDSLDSQRIREIIRDDYLRDSTVTILLAGTETKNRKHIDWEIYSSMIDGSKNNRSGILVINLPTVNCNYYTASHPGEKDLIYPEESNWTNINSRNEYERRYPHLPDRIIDNLLHNKANISITNWNRISRNIEGFRFLIHKSSKNRLNCEYDLSRSMRRANS